MSSQKGPFFIIAHLHVLIALGVAAFFKNNSPFFDSKLYRSMNVFSLQKKSRRPLFKMILALLNGVLNHHAFLKKVAENIGTYNKTQLANLSFQVKENIRLGDMVMSYLKSNDGYFNFSKIYFNNKTAHVIFRIYSQIEGLNYFDCELKRINGKINITDVFIYYAGELWTTSYARHMKLLAEYNMGITDSIHPENQFHNSLLKVDYISELLYSGKVDHAELVYSSIPDQFQKDKIIRGVFLKIAHQRGDSAYVNAINHFLQLDPDNRRFNLFFKLLQNLAANKNHEARQSIIDLNEITGKDPLMQLFVGQTFQNELHFEKAIVCYDGVIDRYPDLFETYWYKLIALIQSNNFSEAVNFLDSIVFNFEARKIDLEDLLEDYPKFIHSNEYSNWRNTINI